MRIIGLSILMVGVLSGCSYSTFRPDNGAVAFSPVTPNSVKVYAADHLAQKYKVLGNVALDSMGSREKLLIELKEKAASIGANAVIDVRLVKWSSFGERIGVSGVAVRVE